MAALAGPPGRFPPSRYNGQVIEVEDFTKVYGGLKAVDGLSFTVRGGEVVGLIGPNGAGKTTTVRSIAGILRPSAGRIRVAGYDSVQSPIEAKRRLALIPDEAQLFDYLTADEHLRLMARLHGVVDGDRRRLDLLEQLDLAGKANALPGELSRGMRQKLALACGLIHDQSALLLDEQLTGLDPFGICGPQAGLRR